VPKTTGSVPGVIITVRPKPDTLKDVLANPQQSVIYQLFINYKNNKPDAYCFP